MGIIRPFSSTFRSGLTVSLLVMFVSGSHFAEAQKIAIGFRGGMRR